MSRPSTIRWNVATVVLIGLGGFALRTVSAQQASRSDSSTAHVSVGSAQTMLGIVQLKVAVLK